MNISQTFADVKEVFDWPLKWNVYGQPSCAKQWCKEPDFMNGAIILFGRFDLTMIYDALQHHIHTVDIH